MDSSIRFQQIKDHSQAVNVKHPPENPYTIEINGTTINIRFAGDESINHCLAGAFSTMLG